jgi:hypothetical protein
VQTLRILPELLLQGLDWLLSLAERLVALGICAAALYLGFRFLAGRASNSDVQFMSAASTNWKVLLVILVPLFFPTIKKLILETKKIGPWERQLPGIPGSDEQRVTESKD